MQCPLCGADMTTRNSTRKGTVTHTCSRWPECGASGTTVLIHLVEELKAQVGETATVKRDNERLTLQLAESRESVVRLADKYADARAVNLYGAEPTNVSLPVRLGDILPSREWFEKRRGAE